MSFGLAIKAAERGYLPDSLVRYGIRRIVSHRLNEGRDELAEATLKAEMSAGPLALATDEANDQHYELPPEFFVRSLGPRLKYSGALFNSKNTTLAEAEESMLALYLQRGQLKDGQRILELGCGWGSLSLYMAEKLPGAEIISVSNSAPQREYIQQQAKDRGLTNLKIITANMLDFTPANHGEGAGFDRVISIEMFEHMHNYHELLRRISTWLKPDGKMFVHIFCHKNRFYKYEIGGAKNWMAQYFFTGGTMPSYDLFTRFDEHMTQLDSWWVDGTHYQETSEAWLKNMDAVKKTTLPIFKEHYGAEADVWWQRWRFFYMAVAEMFGYKNGSEWGVGHYLLGVK